MKKLLLLMVLMSLMACNWIPGEMALLQIAPDKLGEERLVEQRMQIVWHDKTYMLDSVLDLSSGHAQLIGSSMGLRLFSLDYDGKAISEGLGAGLPKGLPSERIVNDMLLIYAPEAELRAALPEGWTLESTATGRILKHGDDPVVEVLYHAATPWDGRVVLRHLRLSYQLTVDSALVP